METVAPAMRAGLLNALGEDSSGGGARQGHDDREFVTAKAAGEIRISAGRTHGLRDLNQGTISSRM